MSVNDESALYSEAEEQSESLLSKEASETPINHQSNGIKWIFTLVSIVIIAVLAISQIPNNSVNSILLCLNPTSQIFNQSINARNESHAQALIVRLQPPNFYDSEAIQQSINQSTNHTVKQAVCLTRFRAQFGNHLYQLLLVIRYALKNDMYLYLPPAPEAQFLSTFSQFIVVCPPTPEVLYRFTSLDWNDPTAEWSNEDPYSRTNETRFHVTLDGGFQYNTSIYSSDVFTAFRALLKPDERVMPLLKAMHNQALIDYCSDSLIVAIHVRHGDYPPPGSEANQSRIPLQWYFDWLNEMKHTYPDVLKRAKRAQDQQCALVNPSFIQPVHQSDVDIPKLVLFVASDDQDVAGQFVAAGYTVITSGELQAKAWGDFYRLTEKVARFYPDWWMLSQLRMLATSHSSFSLMASVYSEHEANVDGFFYRPDEATMKMHSYDPRAFFYKSGSFRGRNFSDHQSMAP